MSGWAAKQAKKAEWAESRKLDGLDGPGTRAANDTRDAAMGKGEEALFAKKLTKEEAKAEKEKKKAEARAKRDQKKAAKEAAAGDDDKKKKASAKSMTKKRSKENLQAAAAAEAEILRANETEAI